MSDILAQERGNLTVEEQVQQLLQSLQHDSASVKATALQVTHAPTLSYDRHISVVQDSEQTKPRGQKQKIQWTT